MSGDKEYYIISYMINKNRIGRMHLETSYGRPSLEHCEILALKCNGITNCESTVLGITKISWTDYKYIKNKKFI